MTSGINTGRNLEGRVALVTGAGRGLGREFARSLAAEGARVGLAARTAAQVQETQGLIERAGGTALARAADVTDRVGMERVVADVEAELGPIDILVNNAAVLTPLGRDWEVDPDEWWRTIEINVRGAFLCTHAVLPGMIARRSGHIVNISSIAAVSSEASFMTAYSASKAALSQMTYLLAREVREFGITAFALAPGGPTSMIEILATSDRVPRELGDFFREYLVEGEMQPSIDMLLFLVSGRADRLTGRHISHRDSIADLLDRADDIEQRDLYALRLRL